MERNLFRTMTWLMWLALPLMALRFWLVWDQLPPRMASHFDANWNPNGWMPRDAAFGFALGVTAFLLMVFTVILLAMARQKAASALAWTMLSFFYLVLGFVYALNSEVVSYNLTGQPIHINLLIVMVPLAILVLVPIYLRAGREAPLPQAAVFAEEVHAAPLLGMLMILGGAAILFAVPTCAFLGHVKGPRIAAALICLLLLLSGMLAWRGFRYSFTDRGVEIRTLGYRLRSIPVGQIQQYAIKPWSFWRGYGIRGVGDLRGYVWGNTGVQIKTTQGLVFLGHDQPEKIVRDLDMIKQLRPS